MISKTARHQLGAVLGKEAATNVADAIDGGGGLLTDSTRQAITKVWGEHRGGRLADAFENKTPIAEDDRREFARHMVSWTVASEIIDLLGA